MRRQPGPLAAIEVLAIAILLAASLPGASLASEPVPLRFGAPFQEEGDAGARPGADPEADRRRLEELIETYLELYGTKREARAPSQPVLDPALIERGQEYFEDDCTFCHDASRALEKSKTLSGWRKSVRRMAGKRGADIPPDHLEPIAVYLASLGVEPPPADPVTPPETASEHGEEEDEPTRDEEDPLQEFLSRGDPDPDPELSSAWDAFDFHVTLAPSYRVSARDQTLENEGFFPEVWAGVTWQPEGPLSARVTACVTCHRSSEPESNRVELAEGVIRFDVGEALDFPESGPRLGIEAGRLLVPFGSTGEGGHPGSSRTVTRSLLFNMGQNVNRDEIGPPLLPLPYSDEGIALDLTIPCCDSVSARLDAYAVNGLQGFSSVNFFQSRDYSDNNNEPAVGGRLAFGSPFVQLGGSFMAGRLNDESGAGPTAKRLQYRVYGVDLTTRIKDVLHLQVDYAKRENDQLVFLMNNPRDDEEVHGWSFLGSLRVLRDPGISLVSRYDTLNRDSEIAPQGGVITDTDFTVRRFTWGFNVDLPGGSVLMVNHEHWDLPRELDNVDVIALRWVATF